MIIEYSVSKTTMNHPYLDGVYFDVYNPFVVFLGDGGSYAILALFGNGSSLRDFQIAWVIHDYLNLFMDYPSVFTILS